MKKLLSYNTRLGAVGMMLMALMLTLATPPAKAQTAGQISIGGKVYGGGKNGAINSGNTTSDNSTAIESVVITDKAFGTSATAQASQVTINSGNIVGVFGGGEEGRAYGKTNVTVTDGTIGVTAQADIDKLDDATQKVNGNVFGAGDGNAAAVFGGSDVTIIGGRINGSVYGGGNEADLVGCSELDLQGGVYVGAVFGGARKSNIYGYTFVNIDGLNAKNDLHIIDVYGGNDIAGTIQPDERWDWTKQSFLQVPFELADDDQLTNLASGVTPAEHVNNTWNAFILATEDRSANHFKTLVDNLYGGGNGDYDYTDAKYSGLSKPEIERTYMQLEGGAYGNVYGGGNAATVTVSTDICLYNASTVNASYLESLTGTPSERLYTPDYQFNRVFGGNNKEPMAIRPNWYLEKATVNNLYSGGNAGPMTYFHQTSTSGSLAGDAGILIHVESNDMTVNNVYGGCRMADVNPDMRNGADMTVNAETIDGFNFQNNYAARVLITGGNINNVYGGNDVSGIVYYGSQVEILSSINGDVYGAGNGSYAYTDKAGLQDDPTYGDYYYNGGAGGLASAQALSNYRPNAEKTYVHVAGTASEPTYIGGGLYCGGNSATLRTNSGSLADAESKLNIGSYVIADKVFLGSNGENMVAVSMLQKYADNDFSTLDLTDSDQFEEYMRGVEVAIRPSVDFDKDYEDYSTKFGSLYCGGNVGSMSADGLFTIDFLKKVIIYDKVVGGSNNANVAKSAYNAYHMGGLIGAPDANGNKVQLNIAGLLLEPRVLTCDANNKPLNIDTWHKNAEGMLQGGNIYGGCYSSGYIHGNVVINVQKNAISENVFATAPTGSGVTYVAVRDDVLASTLSVYGGGYGRETEIWGNTTINITEDGQIMKAYGGGEMGVVGKLKRDAETGAYITQTEDEWYPTRTAKSTGCTLDGYTNIEVSDYASKPHTVAVFDNAYNTTVNLNATLPVGTTNNVAKLYAGGFQGTVSGNTTANLNRGRAYDAFGGASNADILGHAETYVGKTSAPTITHNVYGANDFGGLIVGEKLFEVDNTNNEMENVVAQTYVEYHSGHIGDGSNLAETDEHYLEGGNIFGGPCGAYEYNDARYASVTGTEGFCKPMLLKNILTQDMLVQHGGAGYGANSFVNIVSPSTLASDYIEGAIFGAGQGMKGRINSADERGSYVRLASATTSQRTTGALSRRVYGAGYCSNTNRSLVDAYTGYYGTIFGAAHGISYEEVLYIVDHSGTYETNYMGYRSAVRLHDMVNRQMDIYGGGANAGAQESGVVLNGGQARDVYGASYDQGITYAATVDVPAGSTSRVNSIFGGARGKSDEFPCDAFNTFVTWRSADARVSGAIYGGNNNARMTRNAYVSINQPVKNTDGNLADVFGGGYGENTVTLYTEVGLHNGAQVANAYGGGNNGKVLDTPSFRYYLDDGELECSSTDSYFKPDADGLKIYPTELSKANMVAADKTPIYGYQKYLLDTEVIGFHSWIMANYWKDCREDSRHQPLGSYLANDHGHAHDLYFLSTQMDNVKNTHVLIETGAMVAENVYGGGYGANATVSGETSVQLLGGTVVGDIYGGGYGGHVKEFEHLIYPAGGQHELTMSATNVDLGGGSARNVYGGGLNGNVVGSTNVIVGSKDMGLNDYAGTLYDGTGSTTAIAREPNKDYQGTAIFRNGYLYAGDPVVERSLYGGGQNGAVYGTAYLTINQGHVGYTYNVSAEEYVENLDLKNDGDNILVQNGNAFGAGYGPGATVDVTYVNMYGGTIRNSLYGGGEIAAVGRADMQKTVIESPHPEVGTFHAPGRTHVYIYNGNIHNDVFGGGRGYSYDLTGNETVDQVHYTSGYVFGTTEVEVRGGTIGTPESVEEGHGNVFGGGNIGYCFTDAVKDGPKGQSNGNGGTYTGRYYTNAWKCSQCGHVHYQHGVPTVCGGCSKSTNATDATFLTTFTQVDINGVNTSENEKILSEDCRVVISPWAQVIAEDGIEIVGNNERQPDGSTLTTKTFAKGEYVPTAYLNLLKDKNTDATQWAKLSLDGVTVRNAVFAGGNISSGSDKVFANAYTVYGNATASVNDVFFRDLITLGTEHTGGLYGDGNLTFVDGYRELNVTNFGTDYYGQQDHITLEQYYDMNDRERAYFELEYQTASAHTDTYYSCNVPGDYGTDGNVKHYLSGQHISAAEYNALPDEQKSTEIWTNGSKTYSVGDKIKQGEWELLSTEEKARWTMYGFCSIYAGRLLNTIQRADFCGVFGSRLVLQGAQDRVPEVVDYTQYTINRVGEVSLNKNEYEGLDPGGLSAEALSHGNYFGMYNIVNYLGALTSDVDFTDVRTTSNDDHSYYEAVDGKDYGTATYYDWKKGHQGDRKRNNGTCHNTVALAAGVYLEIVNEPAVAVSAEERLDPYQKDWGKITGIIQLDLINVMPGLGGGYVYAKNVHGTRSGNPGAHENLSIYNLSAVNNSAYTYSNTNELIETSGNFIHNTKRIVDDCFPRGGDLGQPAHYWYIRGDFYVYDQYISAYTGSSTAYQENINLPLTITAGANGRLDLIDIKQNYYAYYKDEGNTPLTANDAFVVNAKSYGLNDIITWWDYMQLNDEQKRHFVPETYVATKDYCTADAFDSDGNPANVITKGEVVLPGDAKLSGTYYDPEDIKTDPETGVKSMQAIDASMVFHVSNAVSHDNGYVLAVKLDNPGDWDSWYSPQSGAKKINQADYDKPGTTQTNYLMGPTYYTETAGVYGQHEHVLDEIVTQAAVDAYTAIPAADITALVNDGKNQATVSAAYVAVTAAEYDYDHDNDGSTPALHKNVQAGVGISAEEYAALDGENKAKFAPAYTCLSTFVENASNAEYIYFGTLIPASKYQELRTQTQEAYVAEHPSASADEVTKYVDQVMSDHFDKAYIVTKAGYYGGQHFAAGTNYRALDTWATLSSDDRAKFQFRYDALDALLLPTYPGTGEEGPGENNIQLYDGPYWNWTGDPTNPTDPNAEQPKHQVYGAKQPIDYTAKYNGDDALTWTDAGGHSHTLSKTDPALTREAYENLPNERRHYSVFNVDEKDKVGGNFPTYYIVKESFISGGTNYAAGKTISVETYNSFDETRKAKIQQFTPTTAGTYYICRESYTIGEKGMGQSVTDKRPSGQTYTTGQVPSGVIINSTDYESLVNKQLAGFTIIGNSPIETSTFYVNRESNIFDLSKDRVVTVIYQYKYEESDESGNNVEEITERHVINIHITFKSGVPTIGKLQNPSIVLPGQTVGLKAPGVTPGAYEILGAGWELFTNPEDAEKHTNGKTYVNNATPMYWYQDGYYVAYYAKTYLGKTYSNSVPFKVANYHDIAEVMADNQNYMYIDHPDVKRNSKIYIHDEVVENLTVNHADAVDASGNGIAPIKRTESEIDMLYSLFQNSLMTSLKRTYVAVQDQEEIDGQKQYWVVDPETGKPTTNKTTSANAYPVNLYYKVDGAGNKTNETTTDITAYPVTHQEPQDVPVFNNHARNLANLDFFLSDDVSTAKDGDWTSIGNETDGCFMGTLHGMGYTISGLENSLFENLCGYVYNLGVTGSFTRSGIADRVSEGTVPDTGDAEKGIPATKVHGHVNSSWIYTSADPEAVAAAAHSVDNTDPENPVVTDYLPVVGVPNDLSQGLAGVHTLNCYFPEECGYPMGILSRGPNTTANSATLREFNNGEVAYDLNGFYLNKRYSDNALSQDDKNTITGHTSPSTGDAAIYKYWKQDSNGTLESTPTIGYYLGGGSMHAYNGQNLGYVERLFADGDFVYKYGTIPTETNERYSTSDSRYLPVWPDDYYFFGQQLTYGYDETERPYQPLPSHTRKTTSKDGSGQDNRLVTTEQNNIIYRLPAYFRSSEKKWVHLNPYAVFADHMKEDYTLGNTEADKVLDGKEIHPGLTAIDFTGFNDRAIMVDAGTDHQKFIGVDAASGLNKPKLVFSNGSRNISGIEGYSNTLDAHGHCYDFSPLNDGAYFGPITDYTTIMSFETHGITQNLLTYAPTTTYSSGTAHTLEVLQEYFNEPTYANHYSNDKYRKVDALDASRISSIRGHLVQKENSADLDRHYYYAASDHFLVDRQDFNAPFEYEFNPAKGGSTDYRMWYQRQPDNYADRNEGWEGVSLPFTAELVTTQDKGEITHFYQSSDGTFQRGYQSGHEYWLREFTRTETTVDNSHSPATQTVTAVLDFPAQEAGNKTVTNTFLWDYYYNADGKDANNDDYRYEGNNEDNNSAPSRNYYRYNRIHENYPLQQAGKAYIAGFPGSRYYEFDLSGTFVPQNSGTTRPAQLAPQTISFVSNTGITIRVSDKEINDAVSPEHVFGGYAFAPNYLNDVAPASTSDQAYLLLNNVGSAYERTTADTNLGAFRPYFLSMNANPANILRVQISDMQPTDNRVEEDVQDDNTISSSNTNERLRIYTRKGKIVVLSEYEVPVAVNIVNMTGVSIARFTLEPGARVTTYAHVPGAYLVNSAKVLVK